ncbi:MAG: microcin C transport system permease protein [Candidatus Promineifilaceae bacterium]|jgi:microcin C transport system permease protein
MQRTEYFIRRLLLIIPTFLGITLMCYALTQFIPGGPVDQRMMAMKGGSIGGEGATLSDATTAVTEDYRKQLQAYYGFDKPFLEQYFNWLWHQGLGLNMESYAYPGKTAWQLIRDRLPVSLIFGITGFLLSYLICIPLGIAKALRHGGHFDFASSVIVFVGFATPPIALGMITRMLLCGTVDGLWDIFPVSGFQSDNFDELSSWDKVCDTTSHMFLPVLCYVIGNFAVLTVLMKNSLLDQIGSEYIRTVLAKGGTRTRAIWGHAFRNSLIPIATGLGGILTVMFAGSVIIERMFEIEGMGRLGFDAIVGRDYVVFLGTLSITSILSLLGNVVSDFCYVLIDPRIHFEKT